MNGILQSRERAFEYEFFHKVDQKLLQDLREKNELKHRRDALCHHTGIRDVAVLKELTELGIDHTTVLAMTLFPLVQVAWADGDVARAERAEVLRSAECTCGTDGPAYRLLETWLNERPSDNLVHAWRDYVVELMEQLPPNARDKLRDELLTQARQVAAAAGGILGIGRISKPEQKVLAELEFFLSEPYPPV